MELPDGEVGDSAGLGNLTIALRLIGFILAVKKYCRTMMNFGDLQHLVRHVVKSLATFDQQGNFQFGERSREKLQVLQPKPNLA